MATNPLGSIEDLMSSQPSDKNTATPSAQADLHKRMESIRFDEVEQAVEHKAAVLGFSYVNLKGFPISPEALRLLPEERARELQAVPFLLHGEQVRIAAIDPQAQAVQDMAHELSEREHLEAELYLISARSLEQALAMYARLPKIKDVSRGVEIHQEEIARFQEQMHSLKDIQGVLDQANTTDLVAGILAAALQVDSSDVHIEAEEQTIVIRYRIDGLLQTAATLSHDRWKQLINRIKLVAGLKLNITTAPQDGRFTIFLGEEKVDVRTSTLPTAFGESVVMRLLRPRSIALEFAQLGFREAAFKKLEAEIIKPTGMIVTTGPTGSGKTTTLYAMLRKLNQPDVKIITLEDPIEYKLEGINQSQIDHTKDYTFSDGLRSILRQDPDIVMVGEMRDKETADTAIQAALTGHLLLSTIHTNDAAGAVPRFLSMGVEASLLAPALRVVMGQRLVRRLCPTCRVAVQLNEATQTRVQGILSAIPANSGELVPDLAAATLYRANPEGCSACHNGYKGRVGIYEILVVNAQVEEAIRGGSVTDADMRRIAAEQGMITMEQDGLLKVLDGLTTIDEIFRVAAT